MYLFFFYESYYYVRERKGQQNIHGQSSEKLDSRVPHEEDVEDPETVVNP